MKSKTRNISLSLLFVSVLYFGCKTVNQYRTWSVYKGDKSSSSYSPLKQINKDNVAQLKLAWTYKMNDAQQGARSASSECNPIIVDGVMYATSARHRVYALNAATGAQLWSFDPFNGGIGGGIYRGVTYWEDGNDKRILFTAGDNLFAVNAATGQPITEFGKDGKVSMNIGMRGDPLKISVIPTSPGIVYKDLLIIGNEVSELYGAEPGNIRAYNIRTGNLEWTFHTIPKPDEFGYDTWPKDAWKYVGGANSWGGLTVDEKRGMVFFGTGSPTYDFYGADRPGANLFGNCIMALDAKTGKYIWHFQVVHHDLWDYDLPAQPNLVTVIHDGKKIDAVAQTSKIGFLYVLDRETGKPLFPIEERPVPASDVPGEQAWPTQPFPLKPKPYAKQNITIDDISNFSQASHDTLVKRFKTVRYEGLFTPPSLRGNINLPGTSGGSNWGGGAFDPYTGIFYVKSINSPGVTQLKKVEPETPGTETAFSTGKTLYSTYCVSCHGPNKNGDTENPSLVGLQGRMKDEDVLSKIRTGGGRMPAFASILAGKEEAIIAFLFDKNTPRPAREVSFLKEITTSEAANEAADASKAIAPDRYLDLLAYGKFRDQQGRWGIKPPWGTLTAINLNTGEHEWAIPVGNDPVLQEKGAPETGAGGTVAPIVTAGGLLFIGANQGAGNNKFRAYDKVSGKLLWEITIPGNASSSASSYMSGKKQYIAVSVAGDAANPAGYIMAFALPD
jgi:quinoprotein glucose dehydrogenase